MIEELFKVGDSVRIRKASFYYTEQGKELGNGLIIAKEYSNFSPRKVYTFENGYSNSYLDIDLELIPKEHKHTPNCNKERCGQEQYEIIT